MMLFALAGNMGGLGARGFTAPAAGSAGADLRLLAKVYRLSRLESAAAPIPNPACLKKWRRVTALSMSSIGLRLMSFIAACLRVRRPVQQVAEKPARALSFRAERGISL